MKKFFATVLMISIMISSFAVSNVYANDNISVTINGVKQNYDVMPVIINGRTLVPMRAIFESLGAKVGWIDHSKTVTGTRNNKTVKLKIDDYMAYIDGKETILDVPATIINSRTMVPVRFISEMLGEKVEWDGNTRTVMIDSDYVRNVAIQPALKPLTNNIHRNIPKEFATSSSYDDITYFDHSNDNNYPALPQSGIVVADMDSFLKSQNTNEKVGAVEEISADGEKIAKLTIKETIDNTSKFILKHQPLKGFKTGDTLVVSFDVKLSEKSDTMHFVQLQLEETKSNIYRKIIWDTFVINDEWKTYRYAISAIDGYDSFGFRPGLNKGDVLVKNFKIINYENQIDYTQIERIQSSNEELKALVTKWLLDAKYINLDESYDTKYSSKDAQWRKDAFDRIEQHRKGDFKVIVKDKNGNIIPDADVTFSMFESEYRIGSAIDGAITKNADLQKNLNKYFNTMVHEGELKWGPYVDNPQKARDMLNATKDAGMKYYRGHAFIWEKPIGTNGILKLIPEYVLKEDNTAIDDRELFDKYVKEWIYRLADDYAGEIDEWDVVNEIAEKDVFRVVHGDEAMVDWFKWAKEATTGSLLVYNDFADSYSGQITGDIYQKMVDYAKFLKENTQIDAIGFQSHEIMKEKGKYWYDNPEETYKVFKTFTDMGYKTMVTEYSHDTENEVFQAEFLRDYFIIAFSVPENVGFTFWEFWDGTSFASRTPIFRKDWTLRPSGEILFDLVYNKFWTHDTTVKSNAEGMASIRGFYGDYDVTVTHNGKTKTLSCSYHKGYDNVLEFVID